MDLTNKTRLGTRLGQSNLPKIPNQPNHEFIVNQEEVKMESSLDNLLGTTDLAQEADHDTDLSAATSMKFQNEEISKMTESRDFSSDVKLLELLKSHFGLTDGREFDNISTDEKALIGMRLATVLRQLSNGNLDTLMQGILCRHVDK